MGEPRTVALDEAMMRADPRQQRKFDALRHSRHFSEVVEANRAYLATAVPDAGAKELEHWSLSCLPNSGSRRLSAISMARMETFVLLKPEQGGDNAAKAFVIARRSLLDSQLLSDGRVRGKIKGLTWSTSRRYVTAGADQVRINGRYDDLIAALAQEHLAAAAGKLAKDLLVHRVSYARHHNYQLADRVLGRAS
ncbi:hypothetical protein [Plantactinospora sonchi]|uniref:Integrase n=1 Tax=Plantactinospora sonchi TaxID=1544735 RepID=A0ABU7RXF6_9ACTN